MSSISKFRSESSTAAKSILSSGPETLASLTSSLSSASPYKTISEAETAFITAIGSDVTASNNVVDALYTIVRDALVMGIANIRLLEKFIGLRVPQMEDGNNFGVTVQMMMSKLLKEKREEFEKSLSETSKYHASRADAIDKFNHISKTSKVETKSESNGVSTGGKDGDMNTTSSNNSTEIKISTASDKVDVHRVKSLAALDAQMYYDLKFALEGMVDDYLIILDNFDKNLEKLENPRGKGYGGYGSGGSSMVY